MTRGVLVATLAATLTTVIAERRAEAYEFWLRSQTYGQVYRLRSFRLVGPDVFYGRRRFSQTLALRIWDIGDFAAKRREARLPDGGPRISWNSYLRVDHDFGTYSMGRIPISSSTRRDAIDVIPELAESVAGLDLLYGYLEVANLGERVTVQLGRVLVDDGWGAGGVDGGTVRVEVPRTPLAVTVTAGARVRASSLLGLAAYELDGTSGAGCREYVEGLAPGTGSWQMIDRDRVVNNTRLASDYEYCPQREVTQPTIGVTVATSQTRAWVAELGYRRTWSATVGLLGDVDRLDTPDVGLYPDEYGQAPSSGINEERIHARVYGKLTAGTGVVVRPFATARVSLLHAVLDRAALGARVERGKHALEPAVEHFYPTFDGDSIFNVFSIEPTSDARLSYSYDGAIRANATAWIRRYADTDGPAGGAWSGGGDIGVERTLTTRLRVRGSALYDDGYGGRRAGGSGEASWRARSDLWLRGRAIVLGVAPDLETSLAGRDPRYVTSSAIASTTVRLGDTAALHLVADTSYDAIREVSFRAIGVLDLAFSPEP